MEKKWASKHVPKAGEKVLCIATFLPLRRWRDVIPFLKMSVRIETQARKSPGLISYGLKTRLPRKQFWTLSVWDARPSVRAFVESEPHATAVIKFEKWGGPDAAFTDWESSDSDPTWATALDKLKKR